MPGPLIEFAPAKVNLTLRVLGRREDGYHDIESLVVFAHVADRLTFVPGGALELVVDGPTGVQAGDIADNLVLRAAQALAERASGLQLGRFALTKQLPVAAGLGGGSSDAAAALRLLARVNGFSLADPRLTEAACVTGADVPVCVDPRARVMRGIGEQLSAPLDVPELPAVLVNPRVAVPTKDVFARLGLRKGELRAAVGADPGTPTTVDALLSYVAAHANDLEPAAIAVQPMIAEVLADLARQPGCRIARMSGSGATCFGVFESRQSAAEAARGLYTAHPTWWVCPTTVG